MEGEHRWTERDIQLALWRSFGKKSVIVMPSFCPTMWEECDVWRVLESRLAVEYEVKVSRADYSRERSSKPSKMYAMEKRNVYSPSYFYYVCQTGLLQAKDMPEWAGLIECDWVDGHPGFAATRIVRRRAPKRHSRQATPEDIERARTGSVCRMWRLMGNGHEVPHEEIAAGDRTVAE